MNLFNETFKTNEQEHQLTSDSKAAAPAKRILLNNRGIMNLIAYIMRTSIYHEIMRSLYF